MTRCDDAVAAFLDQHPVATTDDREFRAARFDAGLAFAHFDEGLGGLGLEPADSAAVEARFLTLGAEDWADRNVIGLGMAAPVIHEFGSPDQQRLLRPLFTGEEIWCQLFSEPGAGSDLAGVATTAVRDGDTYLVNGQKVWTTLGHVARRGLLLARTDPSSARHAGLSYFLLDMEAPGVEVRPLRQLTGEAELNKVFLTDVRVPVSDRLGGEGDGWRIALATLMNERVTLSSASSAAGSGPIGRAVDLYRDRLAGGALPSGARHRLLEPWVRAEVARLTGERARQLQARGEPGPVGSVGKLAMAELNQAIFSFALDVAGPSGMLVDHYEPVRPAVASAHGGADLTKAFLRTRANSIEGGTSEVLRGVLAERVLGLPKEPRPHDLARTSA